jgi:uncharacterized protein (DUF58 family)
LKKKIIKKNKIYIITSKQGFIFLGITFTLFLIGLTYANNFTLLICFILFIFFLFIMFQTHHELEELNDLSLTFHEGNLNKHSFIPSIHSKNLEIEMIKDKEEYLLNKIQYRDNIIYRLNNLRRGIYKNPRIKIYTFGDYRLFYVWSYRDLKQDIIIYPLPIETDNKNNFFKNKLSFQGNEEFNQYQLYAEGMNSQRIDWKVFARSDQLYSKKYDEKEPVGMLIQYEALDGSHEEKISKMSFLAEYCLKNNIPYALNIKDNKIELNSGEAHFIVTQRILAGIEYED